MKPRTAVFLQAVIVLIGIATLAILIRFPMLEGRAKNLDLLSIYADPFILYGYAASIAYFVGLYNAFNFLGCIRRNRAYSHHSIRAVRRIKYCALVLGISIIMAGTYVKLFHHEDDDPAGFLAMCIVATFGSAVVAAGAARIEKRLQTRRA